MKKLPHSHYLACITMTALLGACSGGGGSSTTASTTTLNGQVIDGYISGATVCLDVNSNNVCDAGEPTTTSGANGAYTLPAYTGSLTGLQVIAVVGPTAIDADTGVVGAGNGYSLLAPAAASSTVTPLSTLVSATITAGGGESQVSIDSAKASVSAATGIPAAKLVASDYKANSDANIAAIAKATATAFSQVTNQLSANTSIQTANLSAGDITKAAIAFVQNKVLPQLVIGGNATTAVLSNPSATATTVVSNVGITGSVQNIIASTQSGAGTVASMADIFKAGIVTPQYQSGDYINSAGNRVNGSYGGYQNALDVGYLQFDLATATEAPPNIEYVLVGNNWYVPFNNSDNYTFDGTAWTKESDIGSSSAQSTKPVFDQNCVIVAKNTSGTVTQRYCAVQKNLSSQLMKTFIPSLCDNGPAVANNCTTATFPDGSYAYDLTASTASTYTGVTAGGVAYNGLFELWVTNDGSWNGLCTGSGNPCTSNSGTLFDFINWAKTGVQSIGNSCNVPFKIRSYDATAKTGVIDWDSNQNGGCSNSYNSNNFQSVESSSFNVMTVGGKDVLIVPSPAIYRANNPSSNEPFMIFASQTTGSGGSAVTGIWHGAYFPVGFKESIPFTGDPATNTQVINTVMFDAILKIKGIKAYPYTGASSSGTYNGHTAAQ